MSWTQSVALLKQENSSWLSTFVIFFLLRSVQEKLRTFRQKVRWALSPQRRGPKKPLSPVLTRWNKRSTNLHSARSRSKCSALRASDKVKKGKRQKKRSRSRLSGRFRDKRRSKNRCEGTSETSNQNTQNDIDDIFASIGLWLSDTIKKKRTFQTAKLKMNGEVSNVRKVWRKEDNSTF